MWVVAQAEMNERTSDGAFERTDEQRHGAEPIQHDDKQQQPLASLDEGVLHVLVVQ